MILDSGHNFGLPVSPAIEAISAIAGTGYDLNPDFGSGPSAVASELRRSPLFSQSGEEIAIQLEVGANPFLATVGAPRAQFHAIMSDVSGPNVTLGNFVIIGSNVGPFNGVFSTGDIGYLESDLVAGAQIVIRMNPLTRPMVRALVAKNLRYLRVLLHNPFHTTTTWGLNQFNGRFVKISDVSNNPTDFIYPAGRVMVG